MTTVGQAPDTLPVTSSAAALSGISSKLQKILFFEVLVIAGNSFGALVMIGAVYAMATQDGFTGANLYFGYLADGIPAGLLVAAAALTIVVATRTWKMLSAANSGDVAALTALSSPGWAVVAVFSSYVWPGIALLRVNRTIRELGSGPR
jgi:hypothetical protein